MQIDFVTRCKVCSDCKRTKSSLDLTTSVKNGKSSGLVLLMSFEWNYHNIDLPVLWAIRPSDLRDEDSLLQSDHISRLLE